MMMPEKTNSGNCRKGEDRRGRRQLQGTGSNTTTNNNNNNNNNANVKFDIPEEVKLAAIAVSLNSRLRSADMPSAMQEHALRFARQLVDESKPDSTSNNRYHRPNSTALARSLKKEFDSEYGPAWHCVVGKSFGSFVTHSEGGFVYFSMDSLSILLFKTQVLLQPPAP